MKLQKASSHKVGLRMSRTPVFSHAITD